MQYANFDIQGHRLLLDADEFRALSLGVAIEDAPMAEGDAAPRLCHGAYLPQPGIGEAEALADLLAAADHWLGCLADGQCRPLALDDVRAFPAVRQGRAPAVIPFAALLRMDAAVAARVKPHTRGPALTCFLRYGNLTPAQNLLNRPGILALKGPTRPLAATGGWADLADAGHAARVAVDIFL